MRPRTYLILSRAIEEGLAHAYRQLVEGRGDNTDLPREAWIDVAEREVINAIDEVFEYGGDND